jgi:Peptidase A4 family
VLTQTVAAWAEWYPAGTIWFKNFPLQPGDTIYCSVCLPEDSTSYAVAIMANLTSNLSTFLGFDSPNTAANTEGHLAEWIVETYGGFPYANYGTKFLYECTAGTSKQNLDLTGAPIWDLVPSGSTTAWSTIKQISSSMIQVQPPKDLGAGFRNVRQE